MAVLGKISKLLKDYCANTSLVGLGYISNQKIHLTERIFWLICFVISAVGSYCLIREYQNTFESKAISLVIEDTKPQDKAEFPAVGVCEEGAYSTQYVQLQQYIARLYQIGQNFMTINYNKALPRLNENTTIDPDVNYNIEDYLLRIVFPNMYNYGSLAPYCEPYLNCAECVKCPLSGYKELAAKVRRNCSQLITKCFWKGKPFQCCDYFFPLHTSNGICFVMNSVQTTTRNGPNWLKAQIGWDDGIGELELYFLEIVNLHLMNAEDVPCIVGEDQKFQIQKPGLETFIQLRVQNIINDPGVRDISPEYRKCRFPDENFDKSAYKYYSFTSCISDCLKQLQLKSCGCISHSYLSNDYDKTPVCDYKGYICLDKADIIRPRSSILQPWRSNGLVCKCLPSCAENEIKVFDKSIGRKANFTTRKVKIRQSVATQHYRRQAVRSRLDVVVTIGGILGLFMGASILSAVEIFYFFFVRICNLRN